MQDLGTVVIREGFPFGRLFGFFGGGKFNLVVRLRLSSESFWLSEGRPMGLNYYLTGFTLEVLFLLLFLESMRIGGG